VDLRKQEMKDKHIRTMDKKDQNQRPVRKKTYKIEKIEETEKYRTEKSTSH